MPHALRPSLRRPAIRPTAGRRAEPMDLDGPPPSDATLRDSARSLGLRTDDLVCTTDVRPVTFFTDAGVDRGPLPSGTGMFVDGFAGDWAHVEVFGEHRGSGWIRLDAGDEVALQPNLPKRDLARSSFAPLRAPLYNKRPRVQDIIQGDLGDCFLLAGLGAVAHTCPESITSAISRKSAKNEWKFTRYSDPVRLPGNQESCIVDHWMPRDGRWLKYALGNDALDSLKVKELDGGTTPIWPAVVEKAFAELEGGYDRLDRGGYADETIAHMTGKPCETLAIHRREASRAEGLARLERALAQRRPLAVGSRPTTGRTGLDADHAFTVLDFDRDGIQLFDPAGDGEPLRVSPDDFVAAIDELCIGQRPR